MPSAAELLVQTLVSEAKLGNVDKVHCLLLSKANLDSSNAVLGDTALGLASAYGYAEVVRAILKYTKVDVNEKAT